MKKVNRDSQKFYYSTLWTVFSTYILSIQGVNIGMELQVLRSGDTA